MSSDTIHVYDTWITGKSGRIHFDVMTTDEATALKLAHSCLPTNHPVRLSTALNYSVALYELVRERRGACEIAKAAFDGAFHKLGKKK